MGTAIGTCGHDVTNSGVEVSIMEFSRTCENVVAHCYVCPECKTQYEIWGIVLHNRKEERAWLNGEIQYPLP